MGLAGTRPIDLFTKAQVVELENEFCVDESTASASGDAAACLGLSVASDES